MIYSITEMSNGNYRTKNGSQLVVSGKHGGIFTLDFDWVEELACCECKPDPIPTPDGYLVWSCGKCLGGSTEWIHV